MNRMENGMNRIGQDLQVPAHLLQEGSTSLDAAHTNDHAIPNKRRKLGDEEPAIPLSTASALSALQGAAGGFTKSWFSKSQPDLEEQSTSGAAGEAEARIQRKNGSGGITSRDGAPRAQINNENEDKNGADRGSEDEDASALCSNKYERLWGTASQTLSSGTVVGDTAGYILPPGLDLPLGENIVENGELGEGGVIKLIKRGRGRPRKDGGVTKSSKEVMLDTTTNTIIKDDEEEHTENKPRRKRGRPSKSARRQSRKSIEQGENTESVERHENSELANSTYLVGSIEASENPAALSFQDLLSSLAGGAITILEQIANPNRSSEAIAVPAVDATPVKRKVGRPRKQPVAEQNQVVEVPGMEDVSLQLNGDDDDEPGTSGPRSGRSTRAKRPSKYLDSTATSPSGSPTPLQMSVQTNGLDQENPHIVRQEIPDSQGSEGIHTAAVQKIAALDAPSKKRKRASKSVSVPENENQRSVSTDTNGQNNPSAEARSSPAIPTDRMTSEHVSFNDLSAAPKRKRGRPRLLPDTTSNGLHDPPWLSNSRDDGHDKVAVQPLEEQSAHYKNLFQDLNAVDGSGFDLRLDALKRVVLEKLTGKRRLPLKGLDEEYNKVAQLIEQTVSTGESNSMIITGARGSGKTTLVETAISKLSVQYSSDFYVIRLNGFVQTDDKLALREIWRQLGRELDPEDDAAGRASNYADTLTSLLALLSHPSELSNHASGQDVRSVVFVLEEIDLFASHPRQTLLYNLFDICQARKAPIAVIGISSRVDVVDSLEKRVKSRFSHRKVHVALPLNRQIFWDICKEALTVGEEDLEKSSEHQVDAEAAVLCSNEGRELLSKWSDMISDLYENSKIFQNHIERQFTTTRSVTGFFSSSILSIQSLSLSTLPLTGSSFAKHIPEAPDSKLDMLPALSDLSLALLIAATRLDEILESTCNFNMAYAEYSELASKMKAQSSASGALAIGHGAKVWGKETAAKAWEALAKLELIMPAVATGGGGGVTAKARMYRVDVAIDEIEGSVGVNGLGGGMAKWCREI